jgi:hypothetical protein
MQMILHKILRLKFYGLYNLNPWTCQLANYFVYELWNDLNIIYMLYRDLEYNDFFFNGNTFEQN